MLSEFEYVAPLKTDELFESLSEFGKKAQILAGGTDLLVDIRNGLAKPNILIDIKRISEFHKISYSSNEGLSIGAAVTCADLIHNLDVIKKYPLLVDAASRIGSPQLRNRATIVGNICTASPCADMGCSLLALDASVELQSLRGMRIIKLENFFIDVRKTQRKDEEAVVRIIVPPEMANAKFGMEKLKRIKGHDLAIASVAIAKTANRLRVGIGSCAPTPIVLREFNPNTTIEEIISEAMKTIKPIDDIRASKEFRSFMVQAMIEKIMSNLNR